MKKLFLITFLTLLSLTTYSISEAQKSLENTLKEFQAGKMIDSTDVESAVIAPVFKKMTYKIKNITENENEADIELGIKAVDLAERFIANIKMIVKEKHTVIDMHPFSQDALLILKKENEEVCEDV